MDKITENNFYRMLCNFYSYFGRDKFPKRERASLLHQKLDHLKDRDVQEAFKRMEDDYERMPQNIPKAIKQTVLDLKTTSPDYQGTKDFTPYKYGKCNDCNGYGIFKIRHFKNNIRYDLIKYCGSCRNWQHWCNDPGETVTAKQLEIRDIEFVPYNKGFDPMSYKGYAESLGKNISTFSDMEII